MTTIRRQALAEAVGYITGAVLALIAMVLLQGCEVSEPRAGDAVAYSSFDWCYGGFNGSAAQSDGVIIGQFQTSAAAASAAYLAGKKGRVA